MLYAPSSIHEFFREAISSALREQACNVTDSAKAYLVYLLSDFSRSERASAGVDQDDKPVLFINVLYKPKSPTLKKP